MAEVKMGRLVVLLWLALWCLTACDAELPPPGTVAEVNGEPVSLHAVQSLVDSRTGAMGIPPRPSVAEMRRSYAQGTSILIAHTLVRRELEKKGMAVSDEEVDAAIARIKADYGEAGLEEFLDDAFLREDEWRQLMRDHLSLETFTRRILDPAIRVGSEEIRAWYQEHQGDFRKPEMWRICLKVADSEKVLQTWCGGSLGEAQSQDDVQCLSTVPRDVPQPWQDEFRKFTPGKCGKIVSQDGQWRVAALLGREAATTAKISEVYPLVESAIRAEKRAAAFENWLRRQLAQARVKAMPGLFTEEPAGDEQASAP